LHGSNDWIQVFAGAISTIIAAVAVSHKTNRADYQSILKEKDTLITQLKTEKGEIKEYYQTERDKRIEAELKLEKLNVKFNDLKAKYDILKAKFDETEKHQ
ncbi:MAG: hypothetical protein M3Z87_15005, partial [Lactobacillus sp.]|nr:hypothetical protein [Lactobacillus sp.]